jgi:membrane protease subunit (stomatin/prohibitin family)
VGSIDFTDNYEDLSTDLGFQFKFRCERCGDGFMSSYKANSMGVAGGILRGLGNMLGGLMGDVGSSTYEIQRAVGGSAHDSALKEAVEEVRPQFRKCRRCGNWLCGNSCWNANANMCKECAPIAEEEETAMRAEHVRTQVGNDLFLEENARMSAKAKAVHARCANCGEKLGGAKFCPGCGTKVSAAPANCPGCQAKWTPGAKFCTECGHKAT